jgi:uncharacterized protein YbjT (DUF2867 family)
MIVVAGASGNIGTELVRHLAASGVRTRALSREPARLQPLPAAVEVARADLLEPATLDAAFAGAEKLFLMANAANLPRATSNALPAARRAGVRHVVLVSSAAVAIEPEVAIGRWHREAEEQVRATGLAWTFLRPGNFASNALRWAGTIRAQGAVFAPAGRASAPIDPRDIADVAARALTTEGHAGATHVLTGEELLTAAEQVAVIGAALGRALRFVDVPPEAARAGMARSGMEPAVADAIVELIVAGGAGRDALATTTVRAVTGRAPRAFAQWVQDHLAAFR